MLPSTYFIDHDLLQSRTHFTDGKIEAQIIRRFVQGRAVAELGFAPSVPGFLCSFATWPPFPWYSALGTPPQPPTLPSN